MATDLVPLDTPTGQALALVDPSLRLIEQISNSTFVPTAYRGKPGELLAAILTGAELGVGPMSSIAKIHNVQGRSGLSSELARAIVLKAGHRIWVEESSSERVTVGGVRANDPDHPSRFTWTMDMARKAGLDKKENWRKYPAAMLLARATGDLCRAIFADCLAGIGYMAEELEDGDVEDGPVEVEVEASPDGVPPAPAVEDGKRSKPRKRAARKRAADKPTAAPSTPPPPPLPGEDGYDAPSDPQSTESKRAQMVAIRVGEALGRTPDRDERLALLSAILGTPVATSKDLTSEQVDAVLAELEMIAAGGVEWEDGQLSVVVEAEETTPTAPRWSDDDWRKFVKDKGVRVAQVMKEAQRLAADAGADSPGTLVDVAQLDEPLLDQLRRFIEESGK